MLFVSFFLFQTPPHTRQARAQLGRRFSTPSFLSRRHWGCVCCVRWAIATRQQGKRKNIVEPSPALHLEKKRERKKKRGSEGSSNSNASRRHVPGACEWFKASSKKSASSLLTNRQQFFPLPSAISPRRILQITGQWSPVLFSRWLATVSLCSHLKTGGNLLNVVCLSKQSGNCIV